MEEIVKQSGLIDGESPVAENPEELKQPAQDGGFSEESAGFIKSIYEKIDPKDEQSLNRTVRAGAEMMFSAKTHKYMQQILDKEGDMAGKLGYGIVELMGLLFKQSKGNIPPQIIAPAAAILLVKACEFVEKKGEEMNMDIFGDALEMLMAGLKKNIDEMGKKPAGQQAPAQPTPPAPAAQGLINMQAQGV